MSGRLAVACAVLVCAFGPHGAHASPVLTTVGPDAKTLDRPTSAAFSPNGSLLAVANRTEGSVSMFKVSLGGVLSPIDDFKTGSEPFATAFSQDGQLLATADAGSDGLGDGVTVFQVTPAGGLVRMSFVKSSGHSPQAMAFSPVARLIATADLNGHTVSLYSVTQDGIIRVVDSKPLQDPSSVAFDKSGLLVATSYAEKVVLYKASESGLQPIDDKVTDQNPRAAAFSPDGKLVAIAHLTGTVSMLSVRDDRLTPLPTKKPTGSSPVSVAFNRDGTVLATANSNGDTVTTFTVSPDGALEHATPAAGVTAGDGPGSVAISALGKLAVANYEADSISMFSLSVRGVLTPIGGSTPTEGTAPTALAYNPDGSLLAIANRGTDTVSMFSVLAGGLLDRKFEPFLTRPDPVAIGFGKEGILTTASNGHSQLSTFQVSPEGALSSRVETDVGAAPFALAFRPTGGLAVTVNPRSDSLSIFDVSPTGAVSFKSAKPAGDFPAAVAFSADGTLLATANQGADNMVRVFTVSPGGAVEALSTSATDLGPAGVAFGPSRPNGRLLATANERGHSVSLLRLSPSGSLTTLAQSIPSGRGATGLSFNKDGSVLAVTNRIDDTTTLFRVVGESLVQVGDPTPTGSSPTGIAFHPLRAEFAVINNAGHTVSVFTLAAPALDTVITSKPSNPTANPSSSFAFEANYPATFECRLDDASFAPCGSPYATPDLAEGEHRFEVRGSDLAGSDPETTPDAYSWTIDRSPPLPVTLLTPADGARNQASTTTFTWSPTTDSRTSIKRYELFVDGVERARVPALMCNVVCSATVAGGLTNSGHRWKVVAVNAVDLSSPSVERDLDVDAQPPAPAVLRSPADDAATAARRPQLSWTAADDGNGIGVASHDVLLDGVRVATLAAAATTFTPGADLAEGPHRWQVVGKDAHGNAAPSDAARFVVDTSPPVAVVAGAPNPVREDTTVTFDASRSTDIGSGIARYEWDIIGDRAFERDSGATPSTPHIYRNPGNYTVHLRVTDRAGNAAVGRLVERVTREPGVVINGDAPYTDSTTVTLEVTWPMFAQGMLVSNNRRFAGATRMPLKNKFRWPLARGGRDTKTVFVRFIGGRNATRTSYSDSITLDQRKPEVIAARLATSNGVPVLRLKADDRGPAGVRFVQFTNDRKNPKAQPRDFSETVELTGRPRERPLKLNKPVYLRVIDRAGNVSAWYTARRAGSSR